MCILLAACSRPRLLPTTLAEVGSKADRIWAQRGPHTPWRAEAAIQLHPRGKSMKRRERTNGAPSKESSESGLVLDGPRCVNVLDTPHSLTLDRDPS